MVVISVLKLGAEIAKLEVPRCTSDSHEDFIQLRYIRPSDISTEKN